MSFSTDIAINILGILSHWINRQTFFYTNKVDVDANYVRLLRVTRQGVSPETSR